MSTAGSPRTAVLPATVDRVTAYASAVKRISWGAIFAGIIIALVVQMLLGLLGFGIGIASVDPATASQGTGRGFAIGMAVWWAASSLIALFVGGWVAGRLAGFPKKSDGSLHGVVAWAAMTLLSLYLVTTAVGNLVGGSLRVVGQGLQSAGQVAAAQAAHPDQSGSVMPSPDLREQARQALTNPQSTMAQINETVDRFFQKGPDGRMQINRDEAINQLVQSGKMDRAQAEQTVGQWEQTLLQGQQQLAQVKEGVKQTASEARKPVAAAAIWSFVALSLGALAAGLGGRMGAPRALPVTGTAVNAPVVSTTTTTT